MNCAVHTDKSAAAYCRTCGKALCESCKRDVMGAVYCEPCLAARVHGVSPAAVTGTPVTVVTDPPNPAVAGVLGLIPGVGAMYNGQFIKALVHIGIFVCLIALTDHVSGLFGLLIGFFVIYMAFEAHQTAKARQVGMPVPDHLGINQLFGIHETYATTTVPLAGVQPGVPVIPVGAPPVPAADTTPVGAIVLIALGVIFLIGNLHWIRADKLWPLVLIGLGVWIAYKRSVVRR